MLEADDVPYLIQSKSRRPIYKVKGRASLPGPREILSVLRRQDLKYRQYIKISITFFRLHF